MRENQAILYEFIANNARSPNDPSCENSVNYCEDSKKAAGRMQMRFGYFFMEMDYRICYYK